MSQWAAPVVAVTIFLALRLIYIQADPPLALPNEMKGYELIMEGAAKAHEARNWALFGLWQTHPADEYHFWRAQSPCWVYALAGYFRLVGVGLLQLRLYSVFVAAVGFGAVLAVAARRVRGWPLLLGGLLIAVNLYHVFASRAGLLEPQLNGLLALCLLCLLAARADPRWLIGAHWCFAAAFFTKQSALVFAPVLLLGWVLVVVRTRSRPWLHLLILAHGAVLAYLAYRYVLTEPYWRTVVWNYAHVVHDEHDFAHEVELASTPWEDIWGRLSDDERWSKGFLGILPIAFPLAVIELGWMAVAFVRRRRLDVWSLLVATWFVAAFGAQQLNAQSEVRFYLMLLPPAALLSARLLQRVGSTLRLRERPRLREAALMALAFGCAAVHGRTYYDWLREPSFATIHLNRRIETYVGPRAAVFIGSWAVPLTFDTPYRAYYVKNGFNEDRPTVRQLGVTHLLWKKPFGWTYKLMRKRFPEIEELKPSHTWQALGNHRVELYELEQPL